MKIHNAIMAIHNEVVTVNGNTQEDIVAKDINGNTVNIDWTQVNNWEDPNQYKYDRKNSYPSITDQLDMMWHDKQNDTTTWEDAIAKVKSDNPKASE